MSKLPSPPKRRTWSVERRTHPRAWVHWSGPYTTRRAALSAMQSHMDSAMNWHAGITFRIVRTTTTTKRKVVAP